MPSKRGALSQPTTVVGIIAAVVVVVAILYFLAGSTGLRTSSRTQVALSNNLNNIRGSVQGIGDGRFILATPQGEIEVVMGTGAVVHDSQGRPMAFGNMRTGDTVVVSAGTINTVVATTMRDTTYVPSPLAPNITSVTPYSVPAGQDITVRGTRFSGNQVSVAINNSVVRTDVDPPNNTVITARVPINTPPGPATVIITNANGQSDPYSFTVTAAPGVPLRLTGGSITNVSPGVVDISVTSSRSGTVEGNCRRDVPNSTYVTNGVPQTPSGLTHRVRVSSLIRNMRYTCQLRVVDASGITTDLTQTIQTN